MTGVLDELGLTGLVTSIDGLSAVGAAVILAETGDLTRFSSGAGGGQARRAEPVRAHLGDLGGQDPDLPSRPARAADRGLARGVGRPAP